MTDDFDMADDFDNPYGSQDDYGESCGECNF